MSVLRLVAIVRKASRLASVKTGKEVKSGLSDTYPNLEKGSVSYQISFGIAMEDYLVSFAVSERFLDRSKMNFISKVMPNQTALSAHKGSAFCSDGGFHGSFMGEIQNIHRSGKLPQRYFQTYRRYFQTGSGEGKQHYEVVSSDDRVSKTSEASDQMMEVLRQLDNLQKLDNLEKLGDISLALNELKELFSQGIIAGKKELVLSHGVISDKKILDKENPDIQIFKSRVAPMLESIISLLKGKRTLNEYDMDRLMEQFKELSDLLQSVGSPEGRTYLESFKIALDGAHEYKPGNLVIILLRSLVDLSLNQGFRTLGAVLIGTLKILYGAIKAKAKAAAVRIEELIKENKFYVCAAVLFVAGVLFLMCGV